MLVSLSSITKTQQRKINLRRRACLLGSTPNYSKANLGRSNKSSGWNTCKSTKSRCSKYPVIKHNWNLATLALQLPLLINLAHSNPQRKSFVKADPHWPQRSRCTKFCRSIVWFPRIPCQHFTWTVSKWATTKQLSWVWVFQCCLWCLASQNRWKSCTRSDRPHRSSTGLW